MPTNSKADQYNKMIEYLQKGTEKDPNSALGLSQEYRMSYIPYGIPTLPMLEAAIGRQGIPVGKITELYGAPHCGKTTLAYHLIAAVQKMGGGSLFIDTEQSFSDDRAIECGVSPETSHLFVTMSCKTIESTIRTVENQLEALKKTNFGSPFIIVIDSITGVTTEYEAEREFTSEARTGHEAKRIRDGIKRINAELAELKVPLILINHIISNIPKGPWAVSPSQAAGGNAPKFFSAVRIEVSKKKDVTKIKRGIKIKVAQETVIKVRKNKVNKPTVQEFPCILTNDYGFDFVDNLLDALFYVNAVNCDSKGVYTLFPDLAEKEQTEFTKETWPSIVDNVGYDKLHTILYEYGEKSGLIKPYGIKA